MKLYLDFDRTLFDTERFKLSNSAEKEGFEYGELSNFLFSDVISFLVEYTKNKPEIITFARDRKWQEEKVLSSGIGQYVQSIHIVEGVKGEFLALLLENIPQSEPIWFVDDDPTQLLSVREHCPHVVCVQMARYAEPKIENIPHYVADLSELATLLKK